MVLLSDLLGVVFFGCGHVFSKNELFVFIPFERAADFFVEFFHYQDLKKTGSASEDFLEAILEVAKSAWNVSSCNFELVFKMVVDGLFGGVAE